MWTKGGSRRLAVALASVLVVFALADLVFAQRFRGGYGRGYRPTVRRPTPESFDGRFNFCRIAFPQAPDGDGGGWSVDYPRADQNLSIRLSELTKAPISRDADGEPNHIVLTF